MKKVLFTIALMFVAVTGIAQVYNPEFTDSEALNLAKSLFVGKDVDYYIADVRSSISDTIGIMPLDNGDIVNDITSTQYSFFYCPKVVLVDEEPMKGWEHKCSLIEVSKDERSGILSYVRTDLTMPPLNYDFKPADVKNRYGSNADLKIRVPVSTQNSNSDVAQHTYAVILSGGVSKEWNYDRYWNDCSYIYQTLVNKYNIPKDNIIPIIADGTNPAADMHVLSTGRYVSSPLDLDFDGEPDIQYAATKANVINVLNGLASELTSEDHLFLYVIDHGGTYDYNSSSYICLWNNEKLNDTELASLLDNFNVRAINVLLGQCYSGGFIDNLQKPGRVIATACKGNESSYSCQSIPYDEFVFRWTNAVNEFDLVTSLPVNSDVDDNQYVGMDEAFNYAKANDTQNETPLYSSTPLSIGEDLAFDRMPLEVDLYLKDNYEDTGKEPNLTTDAFWNSSSIWVRNQKDGFTNQESEPVKVVDYDQDIYIFFKVHNRGTKPYLGNGMYVYGYWADASLSLGAKTWLGEECNDAERESGGLICKLELDSCISAGDSCIFYQRWILPRVITKDALEKGENLHICLLGRIVNNSKEPNPNKEELYNYLGGVARSKHLTQKNLTIIKGDCNSIPLNVRNIAGEDHIYNIEVMADPRNNSSIFNKMELSMKMSEPLVNGWIDYGMQGEDLDILMTNSVDIRMLSENSKVESIIMEADLVSDVMITCNKLANFEVVKPDTAIFHVVQRDAETGKIVGGEAFMVITEPRPAIEPLASCSVGDGKISLSAGNVNEAATYEWYDANNILVGKGQNIALPLDRVGEYKLRVIADSDGAVSYASVNVESLMKIDEMSPLPFLGNLNIKISAPATGNTKVRLTSIAMPSFVREYVFNSSEKSLNIDTSQYVKGVYIVNLLENNVIMDTKRIINE